jgi:hypothetical protein
MIIFYPNEFYRSHDFPIGRFSGSTICDFGQKTLKETHYPLDGFFKMEDYPSVRFSMSTIIHEYEFPLQQITKIVTIK